MLRITAVAIFVALCACGKDESPTEPVIAVDREAVDFGQSFGQAVYVGTSKQESLLIQNKGGSDLIISEVALQGPSVFGMELPEKLTVAPGDRTFIRFLFTPTEPQEYSAAAMIRSNAPGAPEKVVQISGTGVNP